MKITRRVLIAALGTLAATLLAPHVSAQCVAAPQPHVKPTGLLLQPGRVRLMPAAFFNDGDHDADDLAIVGFWRETFTSKGSAGVPDGKVLVQGLGQWHRDHTEIALNALKSPSAGNLCMGVWEKAGERTYTLSHFALSWDPTGTLYLGPAHFLMKVTLEPDGQQFRGSFILDQYDSTGQTVTHHYQGIAEGKRITVDSTPESIFSN